MICPCCLGVGLLGGWVGSLIGVPAPHTMEGLVLSLAATISLTALTVFAVMRKRSGENTADCSSLRKKIRDVLAIALTFIVYSIGVNFLLNRYEAQLFT